MGSDARHGRHVGVDGVLLMSLTFQRKLELLARHAATVMNEPVGVRPVEVAFSIGGRCVPLTFKAREYRDAPARDVWDQVECDGKHVGDRWAGVRALVEFFVPELAGEAALTPPELVRGDLATAARETAQELRKLAPNVQGAPGPWGPDAQVDFVARAVALEAYANALEDAE